MAWDRYGERFAATGSTPGAGEDDDEYVPSWSSRNKVMWALAQGVQLRPLGEEIKGFDPELARRIYSKVRRAFDPLEVRPEFNDRVVDMVEYWPAGKGSSNTSGMLSLLLGEQRDGGPDVDQMDITKLNDFQPKKISTPQEWWDRKVWQSQAVINAGTLGGKRAAINRIIKENYAELQRVYKDAIGDDIRGYGALKNDINYTMNAMGSDETEKGEGRETGIGKMSPSNKLTGFIADYEEFRAMPYYPTPNDNLTVGYGHTIQSGEDFSEGISEKTAKELLLKQINEYAGVVNQWATKNNVKLTQQQFDALVSFCYNTGGLDKVAPKLMRHIASGTAAPEEIRKEFEDTISDGVKRLPGLWQRRRDEADMYFNGDYRRKEMSLPKTLFPDE